MIRRNTFLVLFFTLISFVLFGQSTPMEFGEQSLRTQNSAMIVLGSWAVLNMTTGAYGW